MFFSGYLFEKLSGFAFCFLSVFVEIFFIFFELNEMGTTLTMKLLIRRLYFSTKPGRIFYL